MPDENDRNEDAPTYLVPKMGEFAVSSAVFFQSMYLSEVEPPEGGLQELAEPLDPFAGPLAQAAEPVLTATIGAATKPALGVLLTHEQGWFQKGLALGQLMHSLCLAPGEVTKIAVVDWQRRESQRDETATDQSEAVIARGDQQLGSQEVQRAQATEMQTGQSTQVGVASQSNIGGNAGFFGMGVSASSSLSTSMGMSTSISTGDRRLSAESSRNVSQRTQELSQATRSRRATSIREVSQSETENVSTRVVANYNRQHAMTVQYYEVLQVYELKTRVNAAERVIYVPMKVMDFTVETVTRFRERLIAIATELDLDDLKTRLEEFETERNEKSPQLVETETRIMDLRAILSAYTGPGTLPRFAGAFEALHRRRANVEAERTQIVATTNLFEKIKLPALNAELHSLDQRLRSLEGAERAEIGKMRNEVRRLEDKAERLRGTMSVSQKQLLEFLQRDRLVLNQLMWMRLDAYSVHRLLSDMTFREEPLGGQVDPRPLGVFGNYVAFRWNFKTAKEREAFIEEHVQDDKDAVAVRIVLPSEGVFAEAVLGQSNAAEQIDITRMWDWSANPIPILPPDIAPVELGSRARDVGTAGTALDPSLAALPQLQALPGSDLGPILGALQQANIFRNMSGIEQTAALASKLSDNAGEGAQAAANTALEAQKAYADALIKLANSDAGKAAMQLALTAVPGGKAATVLGGLMNAASAAGGSGDGGGGAAPAASSGGIAKVQAAAKTAAALKKVTGTKRKASGTTNRRTGRTEKSG